MLLKLILAFITLALTVALVKGNNFNEIEEHSLIHRLIRSASNKKQHNQQCYYEKGPWEDCDPSSGTQKRELKLKPNARGLQPEKCEKNREISRPCKKVCKYNKGAWSDCLAGEKKREDTLKVSPNSAGCQHSKIVTKKCKTACKYTKAEWSPCENGIKKKELTLSEGENTECEPSKVITKQCGNGEGGKKGGSKGHKKGRNNKKNITDN